MGFSKGINASEATQTKLRTGSSYCPGSGMCVSCSDGCAGLCEIGKSAIRGKETLYPSPYGKITAASQKEYPVDYSHFNIAGSVVGALGVAADSDTAFTAVDTGSALGADNKLHLSLPIFVSGMGSANVAANNWTHLAAGAAISGVGIVVGENVVGMDHLAKFKNGRVSKSPALEKKIQAYRDWYDGKGFIAVQANVEDTAMGVHEYALTKLGVEAVEIKWGQGAKNIGGEVRINTLEKARLLHSRGYIVLPDPENPEIQRAFENGNFAEFERHSHICMVSWEAFQKRVSDLRKAGARYVFLKTGAFRAADLARAVKYASDTRLDLLTVDGAGGGTGMSPWRMMNEWGIPTLYIQALLTRYLDRLAAKGAFVPKVAVSGGFTLEDHVFKALAMTAPYVKAVGMARAPLTAAMVSKNVGEAAKAGKVPAEYMKYGENLDQIFINASELKNRLGHDFAKLPVGAIGVYTYFERLAQGLRQLMCGARKFNVGFIARDDIFALTKEAAEVTGIKYVMDHDAEEADRIIG